jgi:aminoacrylate hydrolase
MAKPAVLLIPGLGGRASLWDAQVEALSNHFDPIAVSHGAHSNVEAFALDAIQLLNEKRIDRCHVVGQSMGGAIAQVLAQDHPERVDRLVLSSTWSGPTPAFRSSFELRKRILLEIGPDAYALHGALLGWPDDWLEAHPDLLKPTLEKHEVPATLARIAAILAFDRSTKLGTLRAPTLVICCEDDNVVPVAHSRRIAAGIPGARLRLLRSGGHFPQVTQTAAYNAMLLEFLESRE